VLINKKNNDALQLNLEGIMAYEKQKTEKHEYWQKHIRACAQSGMSQAEYCRTHGLKDSRFTYYKLRAGNRPGRTSPQSSKPDSPTGKLFIPLKTTRVPAAALRFELPNGVVFECGECTDPVWLGKVLGSLSK
jgi:hypothetical protein